MIFLTGILSLCEPLTRIEWTSWNTTQLPSGIARLVFFVVTVLGQEHRWLNY